MDNNKRIKTSLFLTALLSVTAAAEASSFLYVRAGDSVVLPCKYLQKDHQECKYTFWSFTNKNYSGLEIVNKGQIVKDTGALSDRLSVGQSCFLVITNVSAEDIGQYVCQQASPVGTIPESSIYLFILTNRSTRPLDAVMLTLRVFEIFLLTVITVLLVRAQVKWGSSAGNTECDGDDCTEIYANVGESSASVRFHQTSS